MIFVGGQLTWIWRHFLWMVQIPLGLMKGKVTHVLWPPHRFGPVQSHLPEGRVLSQNAGTRTYPWGYCQHKNSFAWVASVVHIVQCILVLFSFLVLFCTTGFLHVWFPTVWMSTTNESWSEPICIVVLFSILLLFCTTGILHVWFPTVGMSTTNVSWSEPICILAAILPWRGGTFLGSTHAWIWQ